MGSVVSVCVRRRCCSGVQTGPLETKCTLKCFPSGPSDESAGWQASDGVAKKCWDVEACCPTVVREYKGGDGFALGWWLQEGEAVGYGPGSNVGKGTSDCLCGVTTCSQV